MSEQSTSVIYLVSEVRRYNSNPLEAFESEDAAKAFREEYTADFDRIDDEEKWGDYHVGMGGKAKYPIREVSFNHSLNSENDH